jgi:hypothetical protein
MSARPILMGELGLLSLFDLAQLFMLNGATGTLHVQSEGRKGFFRFERGQIANAVDEKLVQGDEAAYQVFGWRTGTFEFRVEPPTGGRSIQDSTEALMLEAARRLDEANAMEGGESLTRALQARAGRFEALREAFQTIAMAARATDPEAGDRHRFAGLSGIGDLLVYRPGMRVRVLRAGAWEDLTPGPLEPAAYLRLCASCFDHSSEHPDAGARSVTLYEDQRELLVTQLPAPHDALVVRGLSGPGALPSRLTGNETAILDVLDITTGLLLVGAPNGHAAERLLHTALAGLLERRSRTVLLVSDRPIHQRRDARGALLITPLEGFAEAVGAFSPDVAVFDVAHASASLEALHHVPLIVSAVLAPDAASLLPRWLARHGLTPEAANVPLAGADVGVLHSNGLALKDGSLPVTAGRLDAAAGDAAAAGPEDAAMLSLVEKLRQDLDAAA